jgi:hypothetical protein
MSSIDWRWVPLINLLNFGKRSHGAKSVEYIVCLSILQGHFGIHFSMLKFVGPFLCPYSIPLLSFWCLMIVCSHKSPHLSHIFVFIVTGQPGCHLPHPLFLLKTSCAINTYGIFSICLIYNKLNISVAVSFSLTGNLMLNCCSVFYQVWSWQVKKSFLEYCYWPLLQGNSLVWHVTGRRYNGN